MTKIIREQKKDLSVLVQKPDTDINALILLLHGWGADAADLMDFAPLLAQHFPHAVIASADGPSPCVANPSGRQWFDLTGAALDDGPYEALPSLKTLIEMMTEEYGLKYKQVALIGFSQGGMMALHTALRLDETIAGVVSFSGALLAPDKLESEKTASPEVMLIHGKKDEVVPYQALTIAAAVLKANAIEAASVTRDELGHGIDEVGLKEAVDFLKAGFGDKAS